MKTRDKIVLAALNMFNEQGERNVTTNHIAAQMNISPGNLYYHFRNKEEIVRAIFENYSVEILERFTPVYTQQESLALLKHYLDSIFNLMWKYRFFYANLPEILQKDEKLHLAYVDVQAELKTNLIAIMQSFSNLQLIDVDINERDNLVTNLHLIASGWIAFQSSQTIQTKITQGMVQQGMLQMLTCVKPFATPKGREQFDLLEDGINISILGFSEKA